MRDERPLFGIPICSLFAVEVGGLGGAEITPVRSDAKFFAVGVIPEFVDRIIGDEETLEFGFCGCPGLVRLSGGVQNDIARTDGEVACRCAHEAMTLGEDEELPLRGVAVVRANGGTGGNLP